MLLSELRNLKDRALETKFGKNFSDDNVSFFISLKHNDKLLDCFVEYYSYVHGKEAYHIRYLGPDFNKNFVREFIHEDFYYLIDRDFIEFEDKLNKFEVVN